MLNLVSKTGFEHQSLVCQYLCWAAHALEPVTELVSEVYGSASLHGL